VTRQQGCAVISRSSFGESSGGFSALVVDLLLVSDGCSGGQRLMQTRSEQCGRCVHAGTLRLAASVCMKIIKCLADRGTTSNVGHL
jgi:hypothetical protein